MRRILCLAAWIVAVMMAMPIVAAPAMADGVSWVAPTDSTQVWSHVQERSQFSIINYHDGYEKMIVSIQVATSELQSGTSMFWLFPIPSSPQDIKVDLISDVPRLEGSLYSDRITEAVASDPMWIYCVLGSQLWPIVFAPFYVMTLGIGGGSLGGNQSVGVFVSADRYGLHSEVLSTDNASHLQSYLTSQGMIIPGGDMAMIADYIDSGYSFVSTRIDNLQDFRANAMVHSEGDDSYYLMGVEADFPTDQLFFPLKLTGAYGDSNIPITVQVLDFVDITTRPTGSSIGVGANYKEMERPYALNDYHLLYGNQRRSSESINQTLAFFDEQIGTEWVTQPTYAYYIGGKFTEIHINGMASSLNSDLWMSDSQPGSINTIELFVANSWIVVLISFIFISTVAGLIVGYHFDRNKKHIPEYLMIGLSNVWTVLVPTLLFKKLHNKWYKERYGEESENDKAPKYVGWKFFGEYTIVFLVLTSLVWGIVSL